MTRILETLLGLARGSRTDAEARPVDLVEIARRRADAWRDVGARRALSIVDVGETGPVMATADRTVVESALDAVIDNAVKYTSAGGVIEVGATDSAGRPGIVVRDHGPGLDPAQIGSATERFWRSDGPADVGGSGLGLAIASDLLHSLGGELSVESPEDGGLRVSLWMQTGETS